MVEQMVEKTAVSKVVMMVVLREILSVEKKVVSTASSLVA